MWITNGVMNGNETGDAFLCYAKTSPKEVSLFLVEKVPRLLSSIILTLILSVIRE